MRKWYVMSDEMFCLNYSEYNLSNASKQHILSYEMSYLSCTKHNLSGVSKRHILSDEMFVRMKLNAT